MDQGTIKIKTSFFFLQWFFFFCRPRIAIDGGEPVKTSWGASSYDVAAGEHSVYIAVPYFGMQVGKATESVTVAAGETVSLSYKPPWVVYMKGRVKRI